MINLADMQAYQKEMTGDPEPAPFGVGMLVRLKDKSTIHPLRIENVRYADYAEREIVYWCAIEGVPGYHYVAHHDEVDPA